MEIIPAIDISNGKCVRLYKGGKGTEKIYYEDPLDALEFWINNGAKRLHIIDLDGAWGSDTNKKLLHDIIQKASSLIKIQVGGGIRSVDSAVKLINLGADRIILGTLAINDQSKVKDLIELIGADKIIIAIDYRKEKVVVHGWTKLSNKDPFSYGKEIERIGGKYILFSSTELDGTLAGPDFDRIKKMKQTLRKVSIYAAGGIRDMEDLKKLENIGIKGVIIGRAFYEQKIPYSIFKNSIDNG
ncbi:MAG: 1-(5-phosphoribosyl)-5-[(5-phosphoribosylamino)methylideneamino]imidazole-4-carboxamide isomerase [Candidatus Thorarchaeota archaeon]